MSQQTAVLPIGSSAFASRWNWLLGVLVLAAPLVWDLDRLFWSRGQESQAPIVLAAILFGFWRDRVLLAPPTQVPIPLSLLALLGAGFFIYFVGWQQYFYQVEAIGLILIVAGAIAGYGGYGALRRMGYLTALLLFVVPLPPSLADNLLVPLKMTLTSAVVRLFSWLGYPIASHGVIISIGFFKLQIADACAGLRSFTSLTAIGFLLIYFMPPRRRSSTILLLLLIPPITVVANFLRVSALVLITYYFGGDAGANAHDGVAYLEMAATILMLLAAHATLEHRSAAAKRVRS